MENEINKILSKMKPGPTIANDTSLFENGIFDSFDLVMIVDELEEFFDVSIPGEMIIPENFENILCINKMLAKLKKN